MALRRIWLKRDMNVMKKCENNLTVRTRFDTCNGFNYLESLFDFDPNSRRVIYVFGSS